MNFKKIARKLLVILSTIIGLFVFIYIKSLKARDNIRIKAAKSKIKKNIKKIKGQKERAKKIKSKIEKKQDNLVDLINKKELGHKNKEEDTDKMFDFLKQYANKRKK